VRFGSLIGRGSTEYAEMEDSSFVGVEAAAAGFGGAAFCAFSGDLGFHLVLLAVLLADGIGRALS